MTGIKPEALSALMNYRWPGNVRELEHNIERAVLLGKQPLIGLEDLSPQVVTNDSSSVPLAEALEKNYSLRDLEQHYIKKILEKTANNKTEAAKILGVDRTTLYRKLEEYKIKE